MEFTMIKIEKLTKSFGRFKALDNIDLDMGKGQAISLLGPNGSGKTTLMSLLTRFYEGQRAQNEKA